MVVAWSNIKLADKFAHELGMGAFLLPSTIGWLKANPDQNLRHLEQELRKSGLNTHLYAQKISDTTNTRLSLRGEERMILNRMSTFVDLVLGQKINL